MNSTHTPFRFRRDSSRRSDRSPVACEPAADSGGNTDARCGRRFAGGHARRSAHHYGRARMAQAIEVRDFHRGLQPHARVDLHMSFGLAARPPHRRLDDSDRVRAGGGDHRRAGLARNDQPLQRSTTLDMVLFFVMGVAILLQTLVSVAVAVALWRQRFTDQALGWALRLGMTLTIIGALTGALMTRPTAAQLADARAGERMTTAGAHTVGGVDGGPACR